MSNWPKQAPPLSSQEDPYRLHALFFEDNTEERPVVVDEVTEKRPVVKAPKESLIAPKTSFKQRVEKSTSSQFNPMGIKRVKAQQQKEEVVSPQFKSIRLQSFATRQQEEMGCDPDSQAWKYETIKIDIRDLWLDEPTI